MKITSLLSSMSIKARVLILALLPLTTITLLLSTYMITSKLNQERTALLENSQSIIRYLAAGAEFGMFSNNISALSSLSKTALERSDIDDVIFINLAGETIYRTGQLDISQIPLKTTEQQNHLTPVFVSNNRWTIQYPVLLAGIQIDDFSDDDSINKGNQIGWVMLIIDETDMRSRQTNILFQGLMITLGGLFFTLWLALNIGRSIINPIQAIIHTIERLRKEDLNARVPVDSKGELGELEAGINNLAKRVQDTRLRLEDQVDEATQSLRSAMNDLERKNYDLDNAKQRAEKANQAKDQFLARMSHELRTPLTSVIGFSQLLQKTPLDNQQLEYSSIVQRTSALLLRLIDDILDFSKLQSEAIKIEHIRFNLEECLEDILEMQTPLASAKNINLYYTPAANLPEHLLGDPTRIRQIITNLVGNSVKFTEQGSVTIQVDCQVCEGFVDLHIRVIDTGIGISKFQMENLFKPFSQADTTITRRFGGSGLGLVISKHLAQLMGGDLLLKSAAHKGTEVSLYLRLQVEDKSVKALSFPNYHVLILEREPEARASISAWMERMQVGYSCYNSPQNLINALLQQPQPDMLVYSTDPGKNNSYHRQLLQLIRRHFSGILLLLRETDTNDSCAMKEAVMAQLQPLECLRQPLTYKKLSQAMDRRRDHREGPSQTQPNQHNAHQLTGLRLLVAEDNTFNRLLLERILSFAGAKVTLAANGEKALALASQTRFDCILMDVHMPLMDGIEAARLIHQLPSPLGETPIMALTANVIANEELALKEVGVTTTLFKPINESQMIYEIQLATNTLPASSAETVLAKKPRLGDYGISEQALLRELDAQMLAIHQAFKAQQPLVMRDHSHQLMGLAGLLDLIILEAASARFNQAVKSDDWRTIWEQLWHLQRVINSLNLNED